MIRVVSILFLVFASLASAAGQRTSGKISRGTRWETAYHVIEGERPGPTVVLTGGVHGDEPAGMRAAEQILHWPIIKGRLVVIPRANVPGIHAGTRFIPGEDRAKRDLNRNFPKAGRGGAAKGELASALWSFVAGQHPDWLIDLHEGYGFHRLEPESVGSSIIDSNGASADAAAPGMLAAVNAGIRDADLKFMNLSRPVDGSLARAAADHLGAATMILETTGRGQPLSLRTRQHRTMVRELLVGLGMMAAETQAGMVTPEDCSGPRVCIYDDAGTGKGGPENIEATLGGIPGALAWRVGAEDIRGGALGQFDLFVVPGGSGGTQGKGLGGKGRGEVRRFVEAGGGYAGICAGAYLAASNYPWSLAISNHRTFSEMRDIPGKGSKSMWYRGPSAVVTMELTDAGKRMLGDRAGPIPVRYHNGPVMSPAGRDGLGEYEVLAWFRSEVSRYEPQEGTMTGTPAMISARFGKGRVLSISPHPESTEELRPLLAKGLQWASGK